jgi:flagellar hook-length control protein FliK
MTAVSAPAPSVILAPTALPNNAVSNLEGLISANPVQGTAIATDSFMALLLSGQQIEVEAPPIINLADNPDNLELNTSSSTAEQSFSTNAIEFNEIKPLTNDNLQLIEQYKTNQVEEVTHHYLTQLIEIEQNIQPLVAEVIIDEEAIDDATNDNEDKDIKELGEFDENQEESLIFSPQENPLPIKQRHHIQENNLSLVDEASADKNSLGTKDELSVAKAKEKNFVDLVSKEQHAELNVKTATSSNVQTSSEILQSSDENLSPTTAVHIANSNKLEVDQLKIPDKAAPAERLATITDSISEQVLMQIERLADDRQAKQGIKVQLYPKELGEIVVHMRIEDNGSTVFEITSNKASSLQLLQLSNLEEVINKNSSIGEKCTLHMGLSQQDLGQNNREQHQNQQNNNKKEFNNATTNEHIASSLATREYYSVINNSALNIAV